ncbi:EAL domain-containing protein [Peribacillus asahii]|uniref:EAL domain-containing protein n=1 Tax=Peribacillus asahii TaxID=228899 RepID=A0A398B5H4_9BACI|nr:EAL domain-containing protein [Peribacillus asahii]RID85329.1 EAL domain-containing protein [Peribacillus asahii]
MSLNDKKGYKSLGKWLKLFSPLSRLRFYPPQFIMRNPMIQAVNVSFSQGYEVAVIVFDIQDVLQFKEEMGKQQYDTYIKQLKKAFKEAIVDRIPKEDILILHDYNSDNVTFLMRIDCMEKKSRELDEIIYMITASVQEHLQETSPQCKSSFITGYMFVEKSQYPIEHAVNRAYKQAVIMTEEKRKAGFSGLMMTMDDIISDQHIRLMVQPIVEVATNQMKAHEVLTRGPAGTDLENPLALFSAARQTGRLYELEQIVLEKTFRQVSENDLLKQVFINLTPVTIENLHFPTDIKVMLDKYPSISAEQFVLEITERESINHIDYFIANIQSLRQLGFQIAVDDTGAGYSNLNTIIDIMPDIIKIDRSVIQNIDSSTVKESMLKGLLLIAKETGSIVVAEGIESKGEAMVLSKNNVDLAQGYFYARPTGVEKLKVSS